MRTKFQLRKLVVIALSIVLFFVSVYLAFLTYSHYAVVVRGISGFVLSYLLFFFVKHSKMDLSTDALLVTPQKGKYLLFEFFIPIISYWAAMQIIEMILFFRK
jgi:hypothetical protein